MARLTSAQATAYGMPCFEAEECVNPAFNRALVHGGMRWRAILTVNIGLE